MDVPFATNFNEYVAVMCVNSPHALVMDWRLDLTLHEYAAALGIVVTRNRPIEEAVRLNDAALTSCIRALRRQRNRVTHKSCNPSSEDAAA